MTHFLTTLAAGRARRRDSLAARRRGGLAFEEFALRHGDFAQSMACCVLTRDDDDAVVEAQVAVGAVTDRPTRLAEVETLLVGSRGADAAADAGALAARLVDPPAHAARERRVPPGADRHARRPAPSRAAS